MSKIINPGDLGKAIEQELTTYHERICDKINEVGRSAIKQLQKLTKASAPTATGSFKKNIAIKEEVSPGTGIKKFIWYVRPPDHRLTHLLVHGHATRNGGRTKADPFLKNALDQVLPKYEADVEEAIKNA